MKWDDLRKNPTVTEIVRSALAEDIGAGDVTTLALIPESAPARAAIIARGDYMISGVDVAELVFKQMDFNLKFKSSLRDGERSKPGDRVFFVEGRARAILAAERTALNFMQRMTGIATLTSRFVEKVRDYNVEILDTRKTAPGLRLLDKYAVVCGGGRNHRMGLYDRILIKDNHWRLCQMPACSDADQSRKHSTDGDRLCEAIIAARGQFPDILIEVEVEDEAQLISALRAEPDWILADNMSADQLMRCVRLCAGKCRVEASGGINFANVEEIARTGVDAISLGCLTHSAPAADLSLEVL